VTERWVEPVSDGVRDCVTDGQAQLPLGASALIRADAAILEVGRERDEEDDESDRSGLEWVGSDEGEGCAKLVFDAVPPVVGRPGKWEAEQGAENGAAEQSCQGPPAAQEGAVWTWGEGGCPRVSPTLGGVGRYVRLEVTRDMWGCRLTRW
jgi:hypothetical protein